MKMHEVITYLRKELDKNSDYTFIVIDARKKKPQLFEAWRVEKQ